MAYRAARSTIKRIDGLRRQTKLDPSEVCAGEHAPNKTKRLTEQLWQIRFPLCHQVQVWPQHEVHPARRCTAGYAPFSKAGRSYLSGFHMKSIETGALVSPQCCPAPNPIPTEVSTSVSHLGVCIFESCAEFVAFSATSTGSFPLWTFGEVLVSESIELVKMMAGVGNSFDRDCGAIGQRRVRIGARRIKPAISAVVPSHSSS